MKRLKRLIRFYFLFLLLSGSVHAQKTDKEVLKKEIKQAENNFQKTLLDEGVANAFYIFAAENAIIKRENDTLITGNEAIKTYYSNPVYKNAVAKWEPDYIDVSDDGTMAYTYGKYSWEFKDSSGKVTTYKGVFHTVWKKMADGSWKYVWD